MVGENGELDSERRGKSGERLFSQLCTTAGLICNEMTDDLAGVDFTVQFRPDNTGFDSTPLDTRPQSPEFKAQIKTVLPGGKSVTLRLSSAEFIAKSLTPAFLFAPEVSTTGNTGETLTAIHIIDAALETLLKRLQAQQESDPLQVNKASVTLNLEKLGTRLPANGNAIREFVLNAIGPDFTQYHERKNSPNQWAGLCIASLPWKVYCKCSLAGGGH